MKTREVRCPCGYPVFDWESIAGGEIVDGEPVDGECPECGHTVRATFYCDWWFEEEAE